MTTKFSTDEIREFIREAIARHKVSVLLEHPKDAFRTYDGRRRSPQFLDEASIKKNKFPFKAIFVLGPAGAGKTFISKQVGIPKDFVVSNPDQRIESVFPAFGVSMEFANSEEGDNASLEQVQQKMRKILQNASQGHTHNLLSIANPIIFDTTGEEVEKIGQRMIELTKIGYDVGVLMINVPTDVSVDRDQNRDRTVGANRTAGISQDYQKQVVQERGYIKKLAAVEYATIFGDDIYPNLYDLRDGSLLDGITDAHVKTMGGFTPKKAVALLTKMREDVGAFLSPEPLNPVGQKILAGMKAMVDLTKGRMGQNMVDVELAASSAFQERFPDAPPAIAEAAEVLARLGGADAQLRRTQRGRKDTGDDTARGLSGNDRASKEEQIAAVRADDSLSDEEKKAKIEKIATRQEFEEEIYSIVRDSLRDG